MGNKVKLQQLAWLQMMCVDEALRDAHNGVPALSSSGIPSSGIPSDGVPSGDSIRSRLAKPAAMVKQATLTAMTAATANAARAPALVSTARRKAARAPTLVSTARWKAANASAATAATRKPRDLIESLADPPAATVRASLESFASRELDGPITLSSKSNKAPLAESCGDAGGDSGGQWCVTSMAIC